MAFLFGGNSFFFFNCGYLMGCFCSAYAVGVACQRGGAGGHSGVRHSYGGTDLQGLLSRCLFESSSFNHSPTIASRPNVSSQSCRDIFPTSALLVIYAKFVFAGQDCCISYSEVKN